jgi:hypothetical protein
MEIAQMSSDQKWVFVSCGQFSDEERALGKQVAELVCDCTPFKGYFAENQTTLATLTENILRRLYESVGLIVIMHHRGTVQTPDRTLTRGSVWVEQEIAVATLMQQILRRPLHIALFIQKGIGIEGIRQQLQLNPVEFVNGDEVVAKLRALLPAWQSPLYVGDEELRQLVESTEVSIRIDNGHHTNVTLEIENHSTMDVIVKSIVLLSKDTRVCGPVHPPNGVEWKVPAKRPMPIRFAAQKNVVLGIETVNDLVHRTGYPLPRADVLVVLRCELCGIERDFEENCKVQIDPANHQMNGLT